MAEEVSKWEQASVETRRKYVMAFNQTMIQIWQEKITLLGVIDTGRLLNSFMAVRCDADGKFTEIYLAQSFVEYGLYQDRGTGKETARGNEGYYEGRDTEREVRPWFRKAFYRSFMNLRDFMEDSLGKEFEGIITDALNKRIDEFGMKKGQNFYHL